jgi:sugar-specific transcriptional regulator TrmB
MDIKEALGEFGLNDREIKVYLALLSNGAMNAYQLCQKIGIIRQTVYEILDSLVSKGVAGHSIRSGVKYFEASNPSKFKRILEEKNKIIESVMPELKKMQESTINKPKMELYEGVEGLKSIYADILNEKPSEILEYGNAENFSKVMKLYFIENYIIKRAKSKIRVRAVIEKNKETEEISKSNKSLLRESRYMQELANFKTINFIYKNKVAMLSFTNEPVGLIIENKEIAETQRFIFELIWKSAKRY